MEAFLYLKGRVKNAYNIPGEKNTEGKQVFIVGKEIVQGCSVVSFHSTTVTEENHDKDTPGYLDLYEVLILKEDLEASVPTEKYFVTGFEEDKFNNILIRLKKTWSPTTDDTLDLKFPKEVLEKKSLKCCEVLQVVCRRVEK